MMVFLLSCAMAKTGSPAKLNNKCRSCTTSVLMYTPSDKHRKLTFSTVPTSLRNKSKSHPTTFSHLTSSHSMKVK